jgi:ribosome-associated protein
MDRIEELKKEVLYKTSRSGGKGGQNVNKVSTKVELIFNVDASDILSQEEKIIIREKLNVDSRGYLHFVSDWSRSQLMNKKDVTERFEKIIKEVLKKKKQRKETKPTKASKEKRMKVKKSISEKKYLRKKDFYED